MYVNAHLSENTVLVYADEQVDVPALNSYSCLECGLEFRGQDIDHCPGCHSDEVQKEH